MKTLEELGKIVVEACGRDGATTAYKLPTDATLAEIGRQALKWGDINKDGSLN